MRNVLEATCRLRCIVCRSFFDFTVGETALVVRHVAYGYHFVHDGACLTAATEWIFPEPGFDCAAFARDPAQRRVCSVASPDGWAAVSTMTGHPPIAEPLRCWVMLEHRDGTTSIEGVIRDDEWLNEAGGAEFARKVIRMHAADASSALLAA